MAVQLLWIRHAHSCGNAKVFSQRTKLAQALFLQTLNPSLSDLGVLQVDQARAALNADHRTLGEFLTHQVDLVCSSNMLRALETAYRLFPDRTITVLPHVGEHAFSEWARRWAWDVENQAQDEPTTLARLAQLGYDPSRVDYTLFRKVAAEHNDAELRPNVVQFVERVVWTHWLNASSAFCLPPSPVGGRPLRVAVVTHGHFLVDLVSAYTTSHATLWDSVPAFQPVFCARPQYRVDRPAVGNLGQLTTLWTRARLARFLTRGQRLPPLRLVYETNAVYDPVAQQCLEYDGRRFVAADQGFRHHVRRCHPAVRDLPTLRTLSRTSSGKKGHWPN